MNKMIQRIIEITKRIYKDKVSKLLFFLSNDRKYTKRHLKDIKDCHKGKRGFIICNGPSLKAKDLDILKKHEEISFACNKIDKIFNQTLWRPTYYAILDETYQHSLIDTMQGMPSDIKFFRRSSYITTHKIKGKKVFLNAIGGKKLLNNPKFSSDCDKKIYTIATTTYALFQLATYMGIKELYIIGCDNSYGREIQKDGTIIDNGKASYFSGSNEADQNIPASTWQMNIAYEYARQYADANDIRIYNATRGGYLEAFERVDFDKLFQS